MRVSLRNYQSYWQDIKNATMSTIGKDKGKMPDKEWKRKLLLSEHSPIRKLKISWKWYDLMYWVSVHFTRHKIGIEHWVSTQRTDRTNEDRNSKSQDSLVMHEAEGNAQSIITISRKRLCTCASKETRQAWREFLKELEQVEPELVSCCVPDCVYRGHCFEYTTCGYHHTEAFKRARERYIGNINLKKEEVTND